MNNLVFGICKDGKTFYGELVAATPNPGGESCTLLLADCYGKLHSVEHQVIKETVIEEAYTPVDHGGHRPGQIIFHVK